MIEQPITELPARQRIAAEVLELGEALFDAAIDAAAREPPPRDSDADALVEVRAAADQFFAALRLLLGLERDEDATVFGDGAEPGARVEGAGHGAGA
jgi:hypothetical protein